MNITIDGQKKKKKSPYIMKSRILRCGGYPDISGCVLNAIDMSPYKREAEGNFTHTEKAMWRQSRKRYENAHLENWSDAATSQRSQAATKSWKRQGRDSPAEPLEGVWPCWHLDFGPVILIMDFCLPEQISVVWSHRFVIIYYSSLLYLSDLFLSCLFCYNHDGLPAIP